MHFLPAPPGARAPPSSALSLGPAPGRPLLLLCPPASGQAPPGLTGPVLPDAPRLCVLDTLPSMVGGWHRGGFPAPPWLQLPVLALPPSEPSLAPTAGPPRTHPEVAVLRVKDRGPRGREPRAWPQLRASHFSSHTLSHRLFIKHVDFQLPALGAARPGPPSCLQSVTSGFHAALCLSPAGRTPAPNFPPREPAHAAPRRLPVGTVCAPRARSPAAPAEAVLCGTSRERAGGRHHSAKLGSPSVAPAGGREAGHGLSGWPASPRPGALPVAGAAQSRSLWGLSPGAECLPSRHGTKAVNGQFRAVKLQTANKYVETGATVIPTSGCPERLLCPGTRSGRTPLGPRGSAASGPSTLFSMSRPGGREPHNGHPWPVSTALATAGKGRPGAQTSAQGGWRLCSRGPGSSPALSKLSRTRGSDSSCGRKTRAAKRPEGREALSPSRGTSTMGRPAGLWRCLRGREGAPRGRASASRASSRRRVRERPRANAGAPPAPPGVPGFGDVHVSPFVLLLSTIGIVAGRMVRTRPRPNPGL